MSIPAEFAAEANRIAPAMFDVAVRSAALLALAGLAALIMRGMSAAMRHWAWLLGFVGLLLLPVVSAALPAWRIVPSWRPAPSGTTTYQIVAAPIVAPAAVAPSPRQSPVTDTGPGNAAARPVMATVAVTVQPASSAPAAPAARAQFAASESHAPMTWPAVLVLCWLAGSLVMLAHILLGHLSLWRLGRQSSRIETGALLQLLDDLRPGFGVKRPVELLSSAARSMPMTWGLLRPRILLPEQAHAWPAEQQRDVLLHELGHVRRLDCLSHFLAQIALGIYWFNPMAWFASRRMQIERERACDDRVLNEGGEPSLYARHLLQTVASIRMPRLAGAAVAMARPSTLEERLRSIMDGHRNRRPVSYGGAALAAAILMLVLTPVALLKAQTPPEGKPPRAEPAALGADGNPVTPRQAPAGRSPSAAAGAPARSGLGQVGTVPSPGSGPTCSFDATIYDVRMPKDQIGRLDVDALAQASTSAEAFEKALAALGTFEPLYRANQSFRLSGDNISITTQTPFVTNSSVTPGGRTINTIQYQNIGATFELAGKTGEAGVIDLDLRIQLATLSGGVAAITGDTKAPVFHDANMSHKGPIDSNKPFVIVSVDAGSVDQAGKAVAFIGRIKVGEARSVGRKDNGQ